MLTEVDGLIFSNTKKKHCWAILLKVACMILEREKMFAQLKIRQGIGCQRVIQALNNNCSMNPIVKMSLSALFSAGSITRSDHRLVADEAGIGLPT